MNDRLLKRLIIIWSTLVLALTGLYAYWMLIDANPPIVVNHFEVDDVGGDRVLVDLEFCKRTGAPPTVAFRAQGVDTVDVYFAQIGNPTALSPGCYDRHLVLSFPGIQPGEYRLISTYTYQVNPVKERTVTAEADGLLVIGD